MNEEQLQAEKKELQKIKNELGQLQKDHSHLESQIKSIGENQVSDQPVAVVSPDVADG